jgi:NADPH:quinone reductase-like Zn-dependent oxidoreductase
MNAAVFTKTNSGKVFQVAEFPAPVPKDNEVLLKVRAASVNPLDWRMKFRHPGVDVAGMVERVAQGVTQLKPGDAVFAACKCIRGVCLRF